LKIQEESKLSGSFGMPQRTGPTDRPLGIATDRQIALLDLKRGPGLFQPVSASRVNAVDSWQTGRDFKVFGATAENESMKYFFDYSLAARYGYGMAVFIAAETSDLQRAIDATNARRARAGRRMLEDAEVADVLSVLQKKGFLATATYDDGANLSGAGAAG
jgi:hypothetical protein